MQYTTFNPTIQLKNDDRFPIHRADGKVIGEVVGQVFSKPVKGSRHMLRVPPAWAVDAVSITQAKQAGAKWIEIHDQESGAIYRCSMANFERHGFAFDRGFGGQIGLALERWTEIKPGEQPLQQLPLFGGSA